MMNKFTRSFLVALTVCGFGSQLFGSEQIEEQFVARVAETLKQVDKYRGEYCPGPRTYYCFVEDFAIDLEDLLESISTNKQLAERRHVRSFKRVCECMLHSTWEGAEDLNEILLTAIEDADIIEDRISLDSFSDRIRDHYHQAKEFASDHATMLKAGAAIAGVTLLTTGVVAVGSTIFLLKRSRGNRPGGDGNNSRGGSLNGNDNAGLHRRGNRYVGGKRSGNMNNRTLPRLDGYMKRQLKEQQEELRQEFLRKPQEREKLAQLAISGVLTNQVGMSPSEKKNGGTLTLSDDEESSGEEESWYGDNNENYHGENPRKRDEGYENDSGNSNNEKNGSNGQSLAQQFAGVELKKAGGLQKAAGDKGESNNTGFYSPHARKMLGAAGANQSNSNEDKEDEEDESLWDVTASFFHQQEQDMNEAEKKSFEDKVAQQVARQNDGPAQQTAFGIQLTPSAIQQLGDHGRAMESANETLTESVSKMLEKNSINTDDLWDREDLEKAACELLKSATSLKRTIAYINLEKYVGFKQGDAVIEQLCLGQDPKDLAAAYIALYSLVNGEKEKPASK